MESQSQRQEHDRQDNKRQDDQRQTTAAQKARECLCDVEFPISRDVLVEKIRVNDPDDPGIVDMLAHIPDRDYQSIQEIEQALIGAP